MSWTACSQTTSADSLCFSKEQAAKILKDIKRGQLCDSIVQSQELQIINFKTIIKNDNEQISLLTIDKLKKEKELKRAYLKLKISNNLVKFGIPVGIIGGFFLHSAIKN